MIPYGRQEIDEEDIRAVASAMRNDFITSGPLVEEFEQELTKYLNAQTFVVNSGTSALHCAYASLGIRPGDEVITPPNTFVATQAAAVHLGAKIIFADINQDTGLISPDSVAEKLTNKTKAIVLVDYAGQPCDTDKFRNLIGNREIYLVQDAAHSFGSIYKKQKVGSLADLTTFSFYPTKNITTGEGGAVSSNQANLFLNAKRFARQGMIKEPEFFRLQPEGPWHQEVHEVGLNYRLTDFQCAMGLSQLKKIEKFREKRNWIRKFYISELSDIDEIQFIQEVINVEPIWHLFPILVAENLRNSLFSYLRENGVGVQVNYFPANRHPYFQGTLERSNETPHAESFYRREISLPNYVGIKEEELAYICNLIKRFFKKNIVRESGKIQ